MRKPEDILVIKSLTIHLFWFSIFAIYIGFNAFSDRVNLSSFIGGASIFIMLFLLVAYLNYILISFIFYEKSFAWRSVSTALINTLMIGILIAFPLKDGPSWLIYFFAILFFFLFELPRFGILSDINESGKLTKLVNSIIKHYTKIILGYFILTLMTLLIRLPYISTGDAVIFIASNLMLLGYIWLVAKRVKSLIQMDRFKKIIKIESIVMLIILLYVISYDIIKAIG